MTGIGSHQSAKSRSNEYVTPEWVISSLGTFDLDPCSPVVRPRPTALLHYTINDDGLKQPWGDKRVWCNPPYSSKEITPWLKKMSLHKNGILLIFNRSDRRDHHDFLYPTADSFFLMKGRITFEDIFGNPYRANGGAPNILFAWGEQNCDALAQSGFGGYHQSLSKAFVIVVGVSPTWKSVISMAINRNNGEAALSDIYKAVEVIAPDKCRKNSNFKEKIRQQLQYHFKSISKGRWASTKTSAL